MNHVFSVHVTIGSLGALALLILAWRRPNARAGASLAALCTAAWVSALAILAGLREHTIAKIATSGNWVGTSQKELILGEAYTDGLPRLVVASAVLLLTLGACLFAFRTLRARLLTLLAAIVFLAPMSWLGTRGIGLHRRMVREAFSYVAPTDDECLALSDAVRMYGGIDAAERYAPRARALAHACVASWLSAMDRGGEDMQRLERRAQAAHGLLRIKGTTALDWIEQSTLLVDDRQRVDVARRRALAASSTP